MASKQGLLTPQPWNKSFTHFEYRAGAVGREGLVNKSQSSLLNFYFRLSGFQSSLLLIHYNPLVFEYCLHCTKVWLRTYPICNAHSIDRHGAAFQRRYRNLANITALIHRHIVRCFISSYKIFLSVPFFQYEIYNSCNRFLI